MNLLTPATSLTFNPTSEILAMASRVDNGAVRLVSSSQGAQLANLVSTELNLHYRTPHTVNPGFLPSSAGPPAELHRLLQLPRPQGGGAAGQLPGLLPAQWLLLIGQQQRTRPFVQVSLHGSETKMN